ncbi:MAG: glycosyltransferase family 39 protein [Acidimicrobiales bacterium]
MKALVRSHEAPTPPAQGAHPRLNLHGRTFEEKFVVLASGLVLAFAVVLRFWTPSPMWLDEALTVNIARAPLHEIPRLLRDDGAPPLYYVLLHFWMKLFGTSDLGARSLSGVIGVLTLPATWAAGYKVGSQAWRPASASVPPRDATAQEPPGEAGSVIGSLDATGRRVAWAATLLVATSPFALYYDTEARMYSLVILLSALGVLAYVAILHRPSVWNGLALAVASCALEYSHYWALYLVATAAVGTAVFARPGPRARSCRVALLALAAGTAAFGPWVPTFWFQLHHTGTPWAAPADFTALVFTFTQFAGGDSDAGRALALVLAFLAFMAVAGKALDAHHVVLDLRTRPGVRALALLAVGTLLVALVAGKVSGSTFADRYSAVILVPCLLVVAYGVTVLSDRRVRQGVVAVAVAFGLAASVPNAFLTRTQAGKVAASVLARARPGDVVAYCPDQLGPAVSRGLDGRFDEVAFPRANAPEIVDWVDYAATVEQASTSRFVKLVLSRAGPHNAVFYVWAPGYLNFGNDCQAIAAGLGASRPEQEVVAEQGSDTPFEIFEGENLYRYAS